MSKFEAILESAYQRGDDFSGGMLDVLGDAVQSFGEAHASQAAASLAYYAMFSLFPLLLALVAIGGFFLKGESVSQKVVTSATRFVPVSEELIQSNVKQVLEQRGTIGFVGLIGLLWSGTGVFTVLTNHINRAWTDAEPRGFLENRLLALGIVGVLAALLLLPILSTPVLGVLSRLKTPSWNKAAVYDAPLWRVLSGGLPMLFTFLIFLGLYRWTPNTEVKWSEALWGALFVAVAWEGGKRGFAWYVSSWLALFGAHLSAAAARERRGSSDS